MGVIFLIIVALIVAGLGWYEYKKYKILCGVTDLVIDKLKDSSEEE